MGGAVFPSCCLTWGQTMVEVMKTTATSFKRSHTRTAALSAPRLQQATANPCLCRRLLDTHGQVWVSLSWGHCSFLLGPGAHKVLFVPSKSLFPQPCVCSGGSVVGLMAISSKRAYAIARSTAPWAPATVAGHADSYLYSRHSDTVLSQSLWGLWVLVCTRFVWALWVSQVGMGSDSKPDFIFPTILLGLLLCPWMWGIFLWWDPTFSCWRLSSSELQFWSSHRRRWVQVLLLCHLQCNVWLLFC